MRRLLAALAVAVTVAGCSTPLTADRLTPSFAETFAGLYESQQRLLGRTDVHRDRLGVRANCRRIGPHADGPGDDWLCVVRFTDRGLGATQGYEVQVKPDGCWKGDGLPARQPAQLDLVTGDRAINPLVEFDACFDTSWR